MRPVTRSPGRSLVDKQHILSVELRGTASGRSRRVPPRGVSREDHAGRGRPARWKDAPVAIPLVIDTDPGIDDALAILLALASPEVDLRLVTTVHGNVELDRTTENALRVLHLAGRSDIPVAAGARDSLVHRQPQRAGHVHGSAGLGGVQLPPSPAPVDPRPAVVALADLLMASAEPVTVAAIGPLTNVALLLRVFPEAAARIGRLPTVLDDDGIDRFAAAGPIGAQAAAMLQQYLDHARTAYGTSGVVVHDALAVSEAIVPGTLGTVRRDVVVDTGLGAGRGQTLVDRRTVSSAPTAVDVAERVDSAAAVEFLVTRLASLDPPR
jgi:pyrimidine-specific ribonucleoside hydrolase